MTAREQEEYTALRATIRERGTARVWVFVVGLAVWAALALAAPAAVPLPTVMLVPLVVLAGVFEAVYALHTGVERIGRYLQVFFEPAGERTWEHTAMRFGQTFRGGGPDPLFATCFWIAAVFNLIPAIPLGPRRPEWVVLVAAHAIVAGRVWLATRRAARQRALDLERFERLRDAVPAATDGPVQS